MQKTDIEWCDYSVNPVKGLCPMDCKSSDGKPYCYARRMYKRFGWNPEIRYDDELLNRDIGKRKFPPNSKVFVGSTMELFGDWINTKWLSEIFHDCWSRWGDVTFIFLTKQPQNLPKEFPRNCWVGVSVTSGMDAIIRVPKLKDIIAPIKFVSFEPLLKSIASPNQLYLMLKLSGVSWVIIGAETCNGRIVKAHAPKIEWIKEIVTAADSAGIPVFLKNNLWDLLYSQAWDDNIFWATDKAKLRQEFPRIKEDKE